MKRIAVVFEEDIFDQKGTFRAKLERIRHLSGFEVDVYCICLRYGLPERMILGTRYLEGVSERDLVSRKTLDFEGVTYRMQWKDYSILDHFLFFKCGVRPLRYPRFLKRMAESLKGYDLIYAHGFEGGFLAREAWRRNGIPYCVTWHGSDIHTKPFRYPCIRKDTASILAEAQMNFFVSRSLLETSDTLGPGKKTVLYNGCSEEFFPMDTVARGRLRRQYGLEGETVVGYVGNLVALKNAHLLPAIFEGIRTRLGRTVTFWVIGDGKLRREVESGMKVPCRFWGNVAHDRLPALMNCMDLLVLPSRQEGLGLVLLEALHCGCKAVGTDTGGIPEVIGREACVPFTGDDRAFIEAFADKAVSILDAPFRQFPPSGMDWEESARKEKEVLESILSTGR